MELSVTRRFKQNRFFKRGHFDALFLFFIVVSIFSIGLIQKSGSLSQIQIKSQYMSPPPYIEFFSFGFQMPLADIFWLRAVQDLDYCENQTSEKSCKGQSWLYQILEAATNLDPRYHVVYYSGSLALTVIISDNKGASLLLYKGVRAFPQDRRILSVAAYQAIYEEKNQIKAAELLKRAADHGGPAWYYALAGRLYSEEGRRDLGQALYEDLKNQNLDPQILSRLKDHLSL